MKYILLPTWQSVDNYKSRGKKHESIICRNMQDVTLTLGMPREKCITAYEQGLPIKGYYIDAYAKTEDEKK